MLDKVDQTLQIWRTNRFDWIDANCLISIADYVMLLNGNDYASDIRGHYSDEQSARDILASKGGIMTVLNRTGFEQRNIQQALPKRGDILLAQIHEQIPGICTDNAVAFRAMNGMLELNINMVRTVCFWSVPA